MKIIVNPSVLSRLLTRASLVRSENVLLVSCDNGLYLRVNNDGMSIKTNRVECTVIENGKFECELGLLKNLMSSLTTYSNITLEVKDASLTVVTPKGKYSLSVSTKLGVLTAIDELKDNQLADLEVKSDKLSNALSVVSKSTPKNDIRAMLNGVYTEVQPCEDEDGFSRLILVGTDGHRLNKVQLKVKGTCPANCSVIIPNNINSNFIDVIVRSLSSCSEVAKITINEKSVRLTINGEEITSLLIDARYPDWKPLVENQLGTYKKLTLPKFELRSLLETLKVLTKKDKVSLGVAKIKNGKATFSSSSLSSALKGQESLSIQDSTLDFEFGFNIDYMLDTLALEQGPEVSLLLTDNSSPIRYKGAGVFAMIMPCRL